MTDAFGRTLGVVFLLGVFAVAGMTALAVQQNPGLEIWEAFVGSAVGLAASVFGVALGILGVAVGIATTVFAMAIAAVAVFLATAPIILILAAPLALVVLVVWAASRG